MIAGSDEKMSISIESKIHNYKVHFLDEFKTERLMQNYELIVMDKTVFSLYESHFTEGEFLLLSLSENSKNFESVKDLIENFEKRNLKKTSKIMCIGGGCLQDVMTLSASLYMRGIDWDFMPTTLQSMADSCIGGKSSINSRDRKNVIGNYYPPKNIYVLTDFIASLPSIEVLSGLIEIMKICYARNPNFNFKQISNLIELMYSKVPVPVAHAEFKDVIYGSLVAKKYFIESDEFDFGPRKLLNFGHTFGHAIETYSDFKINHGVAVGIGMLCAFELSKNRDLNHPFRLETEILKAISLDSKAVKFLENSVNTEKFVSILKLDKKSTKNSINFIIPSNESLTFIEIFDFSEFSQELNTIFRTILDKLQGMKH